ncbi:2-succinyl-5-enolpyruvyl-6-hydroxy-3-cyclohexene-1-carboxylic-acid synthase [Sporolactobacillus sp. Y61]|uniref:2-succinyl-5-enolpyruvyl-6-hydroxy-3-cyclohexene-1-carboxylate synthase n=1 Tax=Sporolactobacillus sp. Y61 TaxID=3160863 RepID=A0AAU8ID62_9BACL
MEHAKIMTAYLRSVIHSCIKNGISDVVISPGSRSTPLALLFAEYREIHMYLDIDERSAAFLALGMAKARRRPVALLCTSGTATANYYPAIIEAYYARVPLVVLTADRPHELQDAGAPQTIDQVNMYGSHVKRFDEIEIPEQDLSLLDHTRRLCTRAIATAMRRPRGPVHLNVPLRQPLLPARGSLKDFQAEDRTVHVSPGEPVLPEHELNDYVQLIGRAKRGVIICGEVESTGFRKAISSFSERLGFPILADPLSQLRCGAPLVRHVVDCYDTFLRDEKAASALCPDLIIRFGAVPVSKGLKLWLKRQEAACLVIDSGQRWRDPDQLATHMIYCDETWFCSALSNRLDGKEDTNWLKHWEAINETAKFVNSEYMQDDSLTEMNVFARLLNRLVPSGASLFSGNSMPIRELDTFLFTSDRDVRLFANRGANGIDGVVSTAVGVSLVLKRTVLLIGDLSFFHDMNGLLAAKQNKADLTIILINNDGGGIFSFLPQATRPEYFERLFGTPHGMDFAHAAHLYGAHYKKASDMPTFEKAFADSMTRKGVTIIEVPADRSENVRDHQRMHARVHDRLAQLRWD